MQFFILFLLFLSSNYVKAQEERAALPFHPAELGPVINHITPENAFKAGEQQGKLINIALLLSGDVYAGSLITNATEVQMVMQGSVKTLDSENLQVLLYTYGPWDYPQYAWQIGGSKKGYKLRDSVQTNFHAFVTVSTDNGNERMIALVDEPGAQSFGTTQCSPSNLGYFICEAVLAVNEEGQVQQYTEFLVLLTHPK